MAQFVSHIDPQVNLPNPYVLDAMNCYQECPVFTDGHPMKAENKSSLKVKYPTEEMKALYLLPLQDGWTREVRLRRTLEKRKADVYYSSPEGLRFRSRLEIMKHFEKQSFTKYDLSHFSFYPEPLGGNCAPYEVVTMAQFNPRFSNRDSPKGYLTVPPMAEPEEGQKPVVSVQRQPRNPFDPIHSLDPNEKVYCICTDVEWGKMVRCCNEGCPLQFYHAACIRDEPEDHQVWYCPICRDSDSSTLNPAYAVQPL